MNGKPLDPGYSRLVALVIIMAAFTIGITYQRITAPKAPPPKKSVTELSGAAEIRPAPKPLTLFEARRRAVEVWRRNHRPIPSEHATQFLRELVAFETTPDDMGLEPIETHMIMNAKKRLIGGEGTFFRK